MSRASFFTTLDGACRLRVVARTGRQLAVSHRPQFAAQRLLRHGDLMFLPEPLAEVDDPPAHHAMHGRDRAVLNHGSQRGAMLIIQP